MAQTLWGETTNRVPLDLRPMRDVVHWGTLWIIMPQLEQRTVRYHHPYPLYQPTAGGLSFTELA